MCRVVKVHKTIMEGRFHTDNCFALTEQQILIYTLINQYVKGWHIRHRGQTSEHARDATGSHRSIRETLDVAVKTAASGPLVN